jgi:hypothetical protein
MIPSLIAPQAVTQDFNIWSFIIQIITTAKFSSTSLVTIEGIFESKTFGETEKPV